MNQHSILTIKIGRLWIIGAYWCLPKSLFLLPISSQSNTCSPPFLQSPDSIFLQYARNVSKRLTHSCSLPLLEPRGMVQLRYDKLYQLPCEEDGHRNLTLIVRWLFLHELSHAVKAVGLPTKFSMSHCIWLRAGVMMTERNERLSWRPASSTIIDFLCAVIGQILSWGRASGLLLDTKALVTYGMFCSMLCVIRVSWKTFRWDMPGTFWKGLSLKFSKDCLWGFRSPPQLLLGKSLHDKQPDHSSQAQKCYTSLLEITNFLSTTVLNVDQKLPFLNLFVRAKKELWARLAIRVS